jgi:hypothetical protein
MSLGAALRHSLAIWLALSITAHASAQPRRAISGQGTEAFRALIGRMGMKPLTRADELAASPKRTLIIVFRGDKSLRRGDALDYLPIDLETFVTRGGAVLVATDQRTTGDWCRDFDVSVPGNKVFGTTTYNLGSRMRLQVSGRTIADVGEFPFVQGVTNAVPDLFLGPNGTRLERVATNRPSYLTPSRKLDTLGVFSSGCWMESRPNNNVFIPAPNNVIFAQGKRYSSGGRILVLADHSIFINDMLLPAQGDTDNFEFAANCIDWLRAIGPGSPRDQVLFIDDDEVVSDFNYLLREMPTPPLPPPEELLKYASPIVAELERSGFFADLERENILNQTLLDAVGHGNIIKGVVALAALVAVVLGGLALLGLRRHAERRLPRFAVLLNKVRPRSGPMDQRQKALLTGGDYSLAARELTRQMFAELQLTPAIEGVRPHIGAEGGWLARRRLHAEAYFLWNVAFGLNPVSISTKEWKSLDARLTSFALLVRNGAVWFE